MVEEEDKESRRCSTVSSGVEAAAVWYGAVNRAEAAAVWSAAANGAEAAAR